MNYDFTTVATFNFPVDAHLTRLELENEGIPCFLMDEEAIAANPVYTTALGGIKLQVPVSVIEHAQRIIREIQQAPSDEKHKGEEADLTNSRRLRLSDAFRCPECASTKVSTWQVSLFWMIAGCLTIVGIAVPGFVPPIRKKRRCLDCDHQWTA